MQDDKPENEKNSVNAEEGENNPASTPPENTQANETPPVENVSPPPPPPQPEVPPAVNQPAAKEVEVASPVAPEVKTENNPEPKFQQKKSSSGGLLKLVIVIAIIAVGVFALPLFKDWEQAKQDLARDLTKATGRQVSINGGIDFSAFPSPSVTIKDVKIKNVEGGAIDNFLTVDSVDANLSFASIIFGGVGVSDIELNRAIINLENYNGANPNWAFSNDNEKDFSNIQESMGLNRVLIKSGRISLRTGEKKSPTVRVVPIEDTLIESDSAAGPFTVDGNLRSVSAALDVRFLLETGDLSGDSGDFKFELISGSSNLKLDGTMKNWTKEPYLEGKLDADVDQSLRALTNYLGINSTKIPTGLNAILSADKAKITGDVHLSSKSADIKSIDINSASIKGSGSMSGSFSEEKNIFNLQLQFDNFNLDNMLDDQDSIRKAASENLKYREDKIVEDFVNKEDKSSYSENNFDLSKTFQIILDIGVKKAKYKEREFDDLKFKVDLGKGGTVLHEFVAKNLPGNSNISILGTGQDQELTFLTEKESVSEINISGDKLDEMLKWIDMKPSWLNLEDANSYKVNGNVKFTANGVTINRLDIGVGELKILGQAVMKYSDDPNQKPLVNSAFQLSKINLDNFIIKNDDKAQADSDEDTYDEFEDERRFDKLRSLDSMFHKIGARFVVGELVFNEDTYKDVSTTIAVERGLFEVRNFKIVSGGFGKVKGSMSINAKNLRPKANINMHFEKMTIGSPAEDRSLTPIWDENQKYTLKRLQVLDGEFEVRVDELTLGRLDFKKVDAVGDFNADNMSFKRFRGRYEGGIMDIKAVIGIKRPSASASFSMVNADFPDITKNLFGITAVKNGKLSASGSLSTIGFNPKSWIKNLDGSVTFTSRGIVVEGFSLQSMSNKIDTFNAIDELRSFSDKALSRGNSTVDYMAGSAVIQRGVIELKDINLSQYLIRFGALSAKVNVPEWEAFMETKMQINILKKGAKAIGDFSVPLNFKLTGNIGDPKIEWDKSGIESHWERKFYKSN